MREGGRKGREGERENRVGGSSPDAATTIQLKCYAGDEVEEEARESGQQEEEEERLKKETIVKEKHTCVEEVYDGRCRYRDGKGMVGEVRRPGIERKSLGNG